jgi:hypothetical protein
VEDHIAIHEAEVVFLDTNTKHNRILLSIVLKRRYFVEGNIVMDNMCRLAP